MRGEAMKKKLIYLSMIAVLFAAVFAGCGRKTVSKPGNQESQTDEMFNERVSDAELFVFVIDDRAYTVDQIYEVKAYLGENIAEGGFYKITADVTFLNGGVAGYVNYPEIRSVNRCEEISPLELNLPLITEKIYDLTLIGDYADADLFLNTYGKMAVWKDGEWIYRYDKQIKQEDGTVICCRKDVSEETIQEGMAEQVILCDEYFVLPAEK